MLEKHSEIRLLPPELCNQIAAGEVVERPASVVKELVENSLDAGADQIDITLENGGQTLIRAQDNGMGIARDQLELALTRHATSKISSPGDLDNIISYGFRGEALPSIASVSRFRIISREKNSDPNEMAALLEIEHGVVSRRGGASLGRGTLIEVQDLFSNTPARLKFLKSPATELKRAQNWLSRLALANLNAGFSFSAGGREILRMPQNEGLRLRLARIWPHDLTEELLPVQANVHGMSLSGLAAPPQLSQPKPDRVLFYVNGRPVNDKRLMSAVKEAYKGRLISRDYPQLVLFVNINPLEIDVNAHPAKTEVRFRNEGAVFSAVSAALGQAFQKYSSFPPPEAAAVFSPPPEPARAAGFWDSLRDPPIVRRDEAEPAKGKWEAFFPEAPFDGRAPLAEEAEAPFESARARDPLPPALAPVFAEDGAERGGRERLEYLGQIASTYLALRDSSGALLLLDQHAAHERVLFHRVSQGGAESGVNLLAAIEVKLRAESQELAKSLLPALAGLGFKLQLDNGRLIARRVPALLTRGEARDFLIEALGGGKEMPRDLYVSLACRGAVKAGQRLSYDEAHELLRQWRETPDAEYCPHGRPCVLRWDAAALERLFKRR